MSDSTNSAEILDPSLWRLEQRVLAADPAGGRTFWRLTVELDDAWCCTESDNGPGAVDVGDEEIRFVPAGAAGHTQWRIVVPEHARPVGADAVCKLKRRHGHRLLVEWPCEGTRHCRDTRNTMVLQRPPGQGDEWGGQINDGTPEESRGRDQFHKNCTSSVSTEHDGADAAAFGTQCVDSVANESETASREQAGMVEHERGTVRVSAADETAQSAGAGCKEDQEMGSHRASQETGHQRRNEETDDAPKCYVCGSPAKSCCSKCHTAWYCDARCQRSHWSFDHRARCALSARILGAERQRRRGDVELAVQTLEDLLKDAAREVRIEAEKQFTFDSAVAGALLRNVASVVGALAMALSCKQVPDVKFCRAACKAVAVFLDLAAILGESRRPLEMQVHVEDIVAGVSENVNKEADPVLSAWMVYDKYAKAVEDRQHSLAKKVPQLRAAALVAFRDVLAAAHDLLDASGSFEDKRGASRIDMLLHGGDRGDSHASKRLQIGMDALRHLRPYFPANGFGGAQPQEEEDE